MVFLSSNTSLYFLCPPPRGLFLVKSSPAGELSYYIKNMGCVAYATQPFLIATFTTSSYLAKIASDTSSSHIH